MTTPSDPTRHTLETLPRSGFVASKDLDASMAGRSIPTKENVRHILRLIPEIKADDVVMHVGGGSGYVAAVLCYLAELVIYVERDAILAETVRQRFQAFEIGNAVIVNADAEQPFEVPGASAPCDLILCTCILESYEALTAHLKDGGALVALEQPLEHAPSLVLYTFRKGKLDRVRTLGRVDFARSVQDILIDQGIADQSAAGRSLDPDDPVPKPASGKKAPRAGNDEQSTYRELAEQHGLALAELSKILEKLDPRLFESFSRAFLDLHRLIPVSADGDTLTVVTDNPDATTESLSRMGRWQRIKRLLVTPTDYRRLWSTLEITRKGNQFNKAVASPGSVGPGDSDDHTVIAQDDDHITPYLVSLYEAILLDAVSARASDIHIEQYGQRVRLRLRVDGDLHDLNHYQIRPRDLRGLISVIKLRAELDISERRLPQGGRSSLQIGETSYDLRIQTQPSLHGEHAVIRLLPQTGRAMRIDELGMAPVIAGRYERLLANPAGLVLVVGPTGSGKSTTLSAGLQTLADDGRRKVITVEDPIEFSIDNIQQTRVRPNLGFSFADAMRSFVRQDPDVILVGEIRDRETALEAIRASQTGHVVLSTLHCNDAVESLQRLYDLGVHPNSIAGELLAVIAQRLAKRICPDCRQPAEPDPAIMAELFPEGPPTNFRCFEGAGCENCNNRGTRGRVAVVEYMAVDADIRNAISSQPPIGELRWRALDSGMTTMRDSALDHVIEGLIPLAELPRILPHERMAPEARGGRRAAT